MNTVPETPFFGIKALVIGLRNGNITRYPDIDFSKQIEKIRLNFDNFPDEDLLIEANLLLKYISEIKNEIASKITLFSTDYIEENFKPDPIRIEKHQGITYPPTNDQIAFFRQQLGYYEQAHEEYQCYLLDIIQSDLMTLEEFLKNTIVDIESYNKELSTDKKLEKVIGFSINKDKKIITRTFINELYQSLHDRGYVSANPSVKSNFRRLLSSEHIVSKVNWLKSTASLRFFINFLLKEEILQAQGNHWIITAHSFLVKDDAINESQISSNTSASKTDKAVLQKLIEDAVSLSK